LDVAFPPLLFFRMVTNDLSRTLSASLSLPCASSLSAAPSCIDTLIDTLASSGSIALALRFPPVEWDGVRVRAGVLVLVGVGVADALPLVLALPSTVRSYLINDESPPCCWNHCTNTWPHSVGPAVVW
jgi:hypothetical protein